MLLTRLEDQIQTLKTLSYYVKFREPRESYVYLEYQGGITADAA